MHYFSSEKKQKRKFEINSGWDKVFPNQLVTSHKIKLFSKFTPTVECRYHYFEKGILVLDSTPPKQVGKTIF